MKPFKGIITGWWRDHNVVYGHVMHHLNHAPATGHFAPGHVICTSTVVKITHNRHSDYSICETQNSFYVLINGREKP